MKKDRRMRLFVIIAFVLLIVTSISKAVYAFNTDYKEKVETETDENEYKDKEIGIAVIEKKDVKDVYAYYYLYYDSEGEVHIVEYIQNPIRSQWNENAKEKKKWILKSDADNTKAKELGAKEYYSEEEEIKRNEKKEATELYKKITEETGNNKTLYDYIEGSTEDEEPYTIESMIFNKVPIFNVNFFSDEVAGKEIKKDSVVGIIRRLIAIWYVTFRNIALIVLAILIIYYGIRMAISTVASEKANYKRILIGWLKSIMVILFIHYIMYIVIYFNETFINIIASTNENEASIYNTIKTRALEAPLNVAVPATILYFALLIMWIRFIISYFKRTFTVAFLAILAPIVGIRYAIENSSGKASQMLSNWVQRFITSVFIQSIHALVYVVFVRTALETALQDLHGFFIALFFLNFILSADKIFINIFKFEFHPDTAEEIRKQFNPAKDLVEWKAGYQIGKSAFEAAGDLALDVKDATANTLKRGYIGAMDALDDNYGGNHRRALEDKIVDIKDSIDDKIRSKIVGDEIDENGRPIEIGKTRSKINKYLKVRKLSRKRGIEGAKAKRSLRRQKNVVKKRFLSEFKIIRDLGGGVAGTVLAIPMIVSSEKPDRAIAASLKIPSLFISSSRNIKNVKNISRKADKEFDKAVKNIKISNKKMDRIERELDKLSGTQKKKAIDELRDVSNLNANSNMIQETIYSYLERNKITKIDSDELELIISDVVENMQGDLSDEEKERIKTSAKRIIIENSKKQKRKLEEDKDKEQSEEKHKKSNIPLQTTNNDESNQENRSDSEDETSTIEFKPNEVTPDDVETEIDNSKNTIPGRLNIKDETENNEDNIRNNDEDNANNMRNNVEDNEEETLFSFGEIARGIEEAVIDEKTSNRFTADLAKEINEIKDINDRMTNNLGGRAVADTNRFLDSL